MSLRYRQEALRVVLYDRYRWHEHPRLMAGCDARRLRRCVAGAGWVVRSCEGELLR
ncbi:hypothetical protein GCM10022233_82940 [Streptomyces shaanxiensis]|uniref:Transposase n=1 Tax=Streptomyces shaanxiensis TaxID=653357 RepID=A0ABP7WEI1_9ACTN